MSKNKSGRSDLVLVVGVCIGISFFVWFFLGQNYDVLIAPTDANVKEGATVTVLTPSSSSVAIAAVPSATKTIALTSTASSGSAGGLVGKIEFTKSDLSAQQASAAERTIFDVEADKNVVSEQIELESASDRTTRLMRETLGISKRIPPTHALDVSLVGDGVCVKPEENVFLIPVLFSYNGASVRGSSFMDLNALLAVYRRCGRGFFEMSVNVAEQTDVSESLTLMRLDELKYFFRQNGVPLESLKFPSNL